MHPESVALAASKLMITRLKELLNIGKSFAFETTGAGTNYIKHLEQAKSQGYEVHLAFLWLASPKQAIDRVTQRVKQGGHHIEKETIVRRYFAGLKNLLKHYLPLVDSALIMDNSSEELPKKIIAKKETNTSIEILDPVTWKKIEEAAQ
ncbi:zeta toxin family protein [Candidatus Neptunochlamydia vexilliferae]|uniref:Zeta toxin domain-containing protein n=1 Tax=Candidatus Neptunichlamydia vexilliferae TaxID=1651774 RepID=A0ABS0AXX1_9BACT|nr:zeta toxin family protein [Candidatus Neptunochlamydia vexilliferae]MBF5058977.1 hypothetical protein [Candidatus Neptunochlamydia vexilliferae]